MTTQERHSGIRPACSGGKARARAHDLTRGELVMALAERIGSLPGMRSRATETAAGDTTRHYWLESGFAVARAAGAPLLFATLDGPGRLTLAADPVICGELVRQGRGRMIGEHVRTSPLNDRIDVTVLWRYVLKTYFEAVGSHDLNAWRAIRPSPPLPGSERTGPRRSAPGAF